MTALPLPPRDYLPHLRTLTGAFAAEAPGDLGNPVPYCGDWTKRDLVTHLGNVHRWAAGIVRTGELSKQEFDVSPGGDLASWYGESAAELLDELEAADPADSCWVFGAAPKTKAFWFRRQVHETAVHLVDLFGARGRTAQLDPLIAADGVHEVLGTMLPRVARWKHEVPLAAPITLRTTDTGHAWTVVPGEPPELGEGEAVATVAAPARDLLVLLWNRTDTQPEIAGDAAVAKGFLAARMTP
ncbi:maleylpyruvate isomerase family mycothiol-dependent enzyme [Amycolatopsis echigonensis]|uniref:Maleylpyruvate isomerase family mycothiol-dependent enzyme n=1 Tax=Amycolatopsis echigonensis TaxID=2576905 RepID=A0A8E1W5C6_9PSEU|nr:maleylpyruvate isomerase family mycothiol-dependent enzyme [Amycolatopsis echigonensis]MBB2504156.1 maleylpyruvate isomerase family mycothiol-dependent enzyme [Amycolatopsis echigonensis]